MLKMLTSLYMHLMKAMDIVNEMLVVHSFSSIYKVRFELVGQSCLFCWCNMEKLN